MKLRIVLALCLAALSVACNFKFKPESHSGSGSGVSKSDSRNIVGFKKIKAQNAIELSVSVTNGYSIVINADENILPSVITELDGDTLVISLKDKTQAKSPISVSVTVPELTKIEIIGAIRATVSNVKTEEFKITAIGASSADVSGQVKILNIKAVGASSVNAEDLKADRADVNAVGASKIKVFASDELNADSTGASSVTYSGDPKSLKQNATDISTIRKK